MRMRMRTIEKLALRPGDRVLDVASGTGLSFPLLREAVGAQGEVVGIDISPEMMSLARQRVTEAGWKNITLLESSIESADIPGPLDSVLFNFTHDILRSPPALKRIFAVVGPNARIAIAGMKYVPWWMAPVNVIVRAKARPYMTTFEGLAKPWDLALPYLSEFEWRPELFGIGYIGSVIPFVAVIALIVSGGLGDGLPAERTRMSFLVVALWILAIGSIITVIQRFAAARREMERLDRSESGETSATPGAATDTSMKGWVLSTTIARPIRTVILSEASPLANLKTEWPSA